MKVYVNKVQLDEEISFESVGDMSSITCGNENKIFSKRYLTFDRSESNEYFLRSSENLVMIMDLRFWLL